MKVHLCYYGELDPFTGIGDEGPASLDTVIGELLLLCLLYDGVLVPPENLLAHPLALPAFEALAPFVRAGRLATSGAPTSPGLHAFIASTAALYREARVGRGRHAAPEPPDPRSLGARRQREIDAFVGRWCALVPERWPFIRDVPGQIAGFTDRVRRFCQAPLLAEVSRKKTLRLIDEHEHAGRPGVERPDFMAHVASLVAEAPARDRRALAMVSQAAYFTMGSEGHRPAAVGGASPSSSARRHRFNGAAGFHRRIEKSLRHHGTRRPSFNGAAGQGFQGHRIAWLVWARLARFSRAWTRS